MKRLLASLAPFAVALVVACSDSAAPNGTTADVDAGTPTQQVGPGAPFATYVIIGDSISDRGGDGPYFYDLVDEDLKAKLGDVRVEKASKAGAISPDLPGQVTSLPAELPGPVAVSVTVGGNDMQLAAINILTGNDATDRAAYTKNVTTAYDELLTDGRFGPGVKVTIFHSTIYDPTDGEGNFKEAGCPGYLAAIPKQPTTAFWDAWNADAATALAKYGPAVVTVRTRETFQGHGVGKPDTWFNKDCIHPNKAGHQALRELFFASMQP